MSLRLKILVPLVSISIVSMIIVGLLGILEVELTSNHANEHKLNSAHELIVNMFNESSESAERVSAMVAKDEELIRTILAVRSEKEERKTLVDETVTIMKLTGVEFITILDETGTVMVRAHQPENFGDKLTNQTNIQMAMQGRQYTTIETGSAIKLSVRSGTPIFAPDGKKIGIVSLGYRLDQSKFVDHVKDMSKSEVTVFLGDERIATTILNDKGERFTGTKASEKISKLVLTGKDYRGKDEITGKKFITWYSPLNDTENKTIGMLFAGVDLTQSNKQMAKTITFMLVVIIVICVIAAIIANFIANRISGPIHELTEMSKKIVAGELEIEMKVKANAESNDETEVLAAEFAELLKTTQEQADLIEDIAHGDITHNIVPKSGKDKLSHSIIHMLESTKKQISVLEKLADNDLTVDIAPRCENDLMNIAIKKMLTHLNITMEELNVSVGHFKEVSEQISSGSQNLAEGSNDNASSLEEISSSLEETSSMTKQNADNSTQAKNLTTLVTQDLSDADKAMKSMSEAINQIKQSSDNTAKIIKTIDEIAFQTNLLALNAAVEAARAGEAGKGFAVVAEEVRNLAMRSAEAAKNTAALIEESVKKSESGVKITEEVAKALNLSIEQAGKVGGLIAEIAAACNEQSQGIEQVNQAVAQVSNVNQQNAANSEEFASSSEELSSQASELANIVSKFKLANGGSNKRRNARQTPQHSHSAQIPDKRGAGIAKALPAPAKSVRPDQIIPLDDEDLGDF